MTSDDGLRTREPGHPDDRLGTAPATAAPTGDEPTYLDRDDPERWERPVDPDAPFVDDPTAPADGLDPGDQGNVPPAPRFHGAVIDPAHPEYFTTRHRDLPEAADRIDEPERRLVVDDLTSRTVGPAAATQPDEPDPAEAERARARRRELPPATPDST